MARKRQAPDETNGAAARHSVERLVGRFLEHPTWLSTIDTRETYARLHDDHDGSNEGRLVVIFGPDGDAHVWIEGERRSTALRFRNYGGGGRSLRTHAALMILAEALRLDQLADPQHGAPNGELTP